jgi:hypothetical protein
MSFVLFNIETGHKIKEYTTEDEARLGMRQYNNNAGWGKVASSWSEGIERELCRRGEETAYAPYGITEWNRWIDKFNPQVTASKNQRYSA